QRYKLSILTMAILYIFAYGFVIYLALFKPYGSIICLIALIQVFITIGLINLAINIRYREKDKQSERKTYAILVGKKLSILTMAILYIYAYGFVIYLALFKPYGSIIWLIALIPVSITIGLINLANNIRDREKDKQSGRKTYAILVVKKLSILTMAILYIFAYGFVIYLALFKPYGSIIWLIALISAPFPIKAIRRFNK